MVAKRSRYLAAATGALLLAAAPAGADEGDGDTGLKQALPSVDAPPRQGGWLRAQLAHVHVHKKTGLAYTRRVDGGERGYVVSVRGPGLGHKRLGLSVELRF
jgi:hypothetical protein